MVGPLERCTVCGWGRGTRDAQRGAGLGAHAMLAHAMLAHALGAHAMLAHACARGWWLSTGCGRRCGSVSTPKLLRQSPRRALAYEQSLVIPVMPFGGGVLNDHQSHLVTEAGGEQKLETGMMI